MENASKALLIAGAILICIVLISVGMMIVSSATDVVDSSSDTTKQQAVQAFNSTFNNYQGTQKGSAIKTLLETISTSNSTNASGHTISVTITLEAGGASQDLGDDSTQITSQAADIVSSAKYKVTVTEKDSEGYVSAISIVRQ